MARYAWTWKVKSECIDEYVKMHLNPWPEIMKAHSAAGFKNYSIFQNGNQFFYVLECDGDVEEAFEKMVNDPDCIRWNNSTSKMLDVALEDGDVSTGIQYLREVFFLK
jgi:L-rhamnose mutarotase